MSRKKFCLDRSRSGDHGVRASYAGRQISGASGSSPVKDVTTGQTGSMTASVANGFAQIVFDPTATTCKSRPYAYHPMYSTSSETTNVTWAAHTLNVAFSDEIG